MKKLNDFIEEKKELSEISDEVKKAYIDYAMSVIVARALPSVEDGLKPVQRRILYTMLQMSLMPEKQTKKTARIVGETLGKFHPHGDLAVYDALIRMAQDFSLRYPLIIGQGNFGSIDGDPPASMRYTEAKLSKLALELLADIDKNTVNFMPNFDNTLKEPIVLPAKVPNLLINGSYGIAVGLATNIPPHNLKEVIDAIKAYIKNPDLNIDQLMEFIKGPDFPTGGIIFATDLKEVYEKGRGKIIIRGKVEVEENKGKKQIIIKEIPFQINKANLVQEIAKAVEEKKIQDIIGIRDESSKKGIRIVLILKKEANPNLIINRLYKFTSLETAFNVILVALVNGIPKLLNLKDLVKFWLEHRKEVVKKRTQFLLEQTKNKKHLLDGVLIALKQIDKIIEIIKKAESAEQAIKKLIEKFELSKQQAQAVLDMKLSKLTKLEHEKIKKEIGELEKAIKEYEEILRSEKNILEVIKKELDEIKKKYGDERRTLIKAERKAVKEIELIKKEDLVITLSYKGYLNAVKLKEFTEQRRGGKGIIGATIGKDDWINKLLICTTHDILIFITNRGNAYALKAYLVPRTTRYGKGKHISNLLALKPEEKIKTVFLLKPKDLVGRFLVMVTKKGVIKKINLEELKGIKRSGLRVIKIPFEDEVVQAFMLKKDEDLIIATRNGLVIRFSSEEVRAMGRNAYGVRAIKLKQDEVVDMAIAKDEILTITTKGYGKRTKAEEYRKTRRDGKGIKNINLSKRNGWVIGVKNIIANDSIILITKKGMTIRIKANEIRLMGRVTQGTKLINLKEGDEVIDIDIIKAKSDLNLE